jgi:hypothetical protein
MRRDYVYCMFDQKSDALTRAGGGAGAPSSLALSSSSNGCRRGAVERKHKKVSMTQINERYPPEGQKGHHYCGTTRYQVSSPIGGSYAYKRYAKPCRNSKACYKHPVR